MSLKCKAQFLELMQQGVGGDVPEGTRSHKINVRYLPEVYIL